MNRLRYYLISLLVIITVNCTAHSNTYLRDTTDAEDDLSTLEAFFNNINYVSANMEIRESIPGGPVSLTSGQCWFRKNNFRISRVAFHSSFEVQNDVYYGAVFYSDTIVIAKKPGKAYATIMQIDLLDTLFRSNYIHRMYVTDSSSGYKVLQVEFKPEAPYTKYRIAYNYGQVMPASVLIVKKNEKVGGVIELRQTEIIFSNVLFTPFQVSFSTDDIFQKRNGKLELVAPYQHYQLYDLTWLP